jgi:hypothetical protein
MDNAGDSRLRFVFGDTVVSSSLAANATFEDVARTLGELSNERYGNPVAIDVTLGSREGDSDRRMLRRTNSARIAEYEEFLTAAPVFEQLRRSLQRSTCKDTISTSPSAGRRRGSQANDLLRQWKTSPIGRVAVKRWAEHTLARDATLGRERTNPVAPSTIVTADGWSGSSPPQDGHLRRHIPLSLAEQDFDAGLREAPLKQPFRPAPARFRPPHTWRGR